MDTDPNFVEITDYQESYQTNIPITVPDESEHYESVYSSPHEKGNVYFAIKSFVSVLCTAAIVCGGITAFQLSALCILSGIFSNLLAVIIIGLELPAVQWKFLTGIEWFFQDRPKWHKGVMYGMLALLPLLMCRSWSSVSEFFLLMGSGVICAILDSVTDRLAYNRTKVSEYEQMQLAEPTGVY